MTAYTGFYLPRIIFAPLLCALLTVGLFTVANAAEKMTPVGKVIFAVGSNSLLRGGVVKPVSRGSEVYVGDQFNTGNNGHIHLLMIDQGFFSVRPNSRMLVDSYSYNPENAAENNVKVTLEEGVLRSITGKAGETNKKQYRLNTPVAAIGVRGTDFTVQTTLEMSRISVRSGGVVMSPFDTSCLSSASGPCEGEGALSMFATDSDAVLEARLGQKNSVINHVAPSPDEISPPLPQEQHLLKQLRPDLSFFRNGNLAESAPVEVVDSSETEEGSTETVDNPVANEESVEQVSVESNTEVETEQEQLADGSDLGEQADVVENIDAVTNNEGLSESGTDEVSEEIDFAARRLAIQGYLDSQPLVELAADVALQQDGNVLPRDRGLVADPAIIWGRWAEYAGNDSNYQTISQLLYDDRRYAAINSVFGMLETKVDERPIPKTGRTFFKLNSYEAYLKRGSSLEEAALKNASLVIDFDDARFATHLNLDANSLNETVSIVGSGQVGDDGFFNSDDSSPALINGVFAPMADEAGYLFEYNLAPGVDAVGATHWFNPQQ